jgi:hypothetical protein
MNRGVLWAVLILGASGALSVQGQQEPRELSKAIGVAGAGTLDRAVQDTGGGVEINAATDSSNATITASRSISSQPAGVYTTLTVTASAPVDKSADRTDLVSLDGLRNAFSLGAKYTWFNVSGMRNPAVAPENRAKLGKICSDLMAAFQKQKDTEKEPDNCDSATVQEFLPDRFDDFQDLFFDPNGRMLSVGIEPKVGYQTFSFLDSATLNKLSDSKVPWSIEAFIGYMPVRWQTLFTVGGNYQQGFKNADNGILCPFTGVGGTVACKTGPVGKPVSDDAELVYLEIRHRFGTAGVSLKVTYDFKEDLTGVDLPISFIKDKDGSLTGGIRVGWTNTGHWQAGIFAGKAFSLF